MYSKDLGKIIDYAYLFTRSNDDKKVFDPETSSFIKINKQSCIVEN